MSADGLNMAESYIRSCWDKGVEVVLDPSLTSAFGTYDAAGNVLTLGGPALADPVQLIETLAEQGCQLIFQTWPIVQRCYIKVKKPAAVPQARYAAVSVNRFRK